MDAWMLGSFLTDAFSLWKATSGLTVVWFPHDAKSIIHWMISSLAGSYGSGQHAYMSCSITIRVGACGFAVAVGAVAMGIVVGTVARYVGVAVARRFLEYRSHGLGVRRLFWLFNPKDRCCLTSCWLVSLAATSLVIVGVWGTLTGVAVLSSTSVSFGATCHG